MTKQDLLDDLRNQQTGLTKAEIERVIDALAVVIAKRLAQGEQVPLPGIGAFSAKESAARQGRNPQRASLLPSRPSCGSSSSPPRHWMTASRSPAP